MPPDLNRPNSSSPDPNPPKLNEKISSFDNRAKPGLEKKNLSAPGISTDSPARQIA